MNRRRVSSPPPARARSSRPLSPSHRARRPRDRIDDRGTESTIARANHTECDDFHARCVDRVTQNVRIARNVRSFTSSRVRRVRRVRRGPRVRQIDRRTEDDWCERPQRARRGRRFGRFQNRGRRAVSARAESRVEKTGDVESEER